MIQAARQAAHTALSLDEFLRRYREEGPFEFVEGKVIPMTPTVFGHVAIANRLLLAISDYSLPKELGEAFTEAPFITSDPADPNWVKGARVPDLIYVEAGRLAAYKAGHPAWEDAPLALVPDLVVEIVSRNDRYSEIGAKVAGYLDDGVQTVWVVDPQRRTVAVHQRAADHHVILNDTQTLTGGEVIPGFEIPVARIFGD